MPKSGTLNSRALSMHVGEEDGVVWVSPMESRRVYQLRVKSASDVKGVALHRMLAPLRQSTVLPNGDGKNQKVP